MDWYFKLTCAFLALLAVGLIGCFFFCALSCGESDDNSTKGTK